MKDDIKKILLNSSNSKTSVNGDLSLNIDLSSDEKKFPSNGISDNIDQYKQYIKEKDASNKYRFVFTINSVCSNVLYNHVSEIIEKKPDGNIKFYGSNGLKISKADYKYVKYKYNIDTIQTRADLIKDTGYSHPNCGNFIYYPGLDIFNNHRFRNKEFATVVDKGSSSICENYNTISDAIREYNGDDLKIPNGTGETKTHLYYKDTFKTYIESIKDNIEERDGWFGFINPTSLDVNNCKLDAYNLITINKVINNKKACEFIDLYPDRSLFSFAPNKNKILNREEYNWDYCITYPFSSFTKNELVSFLDINDTEILNGMLTYFCDRNGNILTNEELNDLLNTNWREESSDVVLCTKIKNNIKAGDYVKIHLIVPSKDPIYIHGEKECFTIRTNVKVRNVGIGGYNTMYYFSVNRSDILSGLKSISRMVNDGYESPLDGLYCYIQRIASGRPCKYYFRKFRRLPNFKNTNIYNDSKVSSNAINQVVFNDFDSSLNKLGFGENIYGDKMAQIVYNDDVDTSNIRDNLGRELHELYLTIIKTNRGNEIWYSGDTKTNDYSSKSIECSHCFSDVSSGIDMPWPYVEGENDDYNVHKIHNISPKFRGNPVFPKSVKPLEEHITLSGSSSDGTFLGDIVELDELNVEEYVLEDVYHRFNTMQREYTKNGEFSAITINEIEADDYDDGGFAVTTENYLDNYFVNLAPEGYYYKAHYRMPIRQFSDLVNEGQHTIVKFDSIDTIKRERRETILSGTTDKNYYFQNGDNIIVYERDDASGKRVFTITDVSGDDFRNIEFRLNDEFYVTDGCHFFKPNILKPSTAYNFDDGSGIYRWRNIESFEFLRPGDELYDSVFTNGAHYIHKNINFYLRRQDPYGLYGLNPVNNDNFPYEYQLLEQSGNGKDVTQAQHFTEGDIQLC